jgi:hypothetical protein
MSKNNFKKVEYQINDEYASNFLCGENLLSYVKSNLSINGKYVLVVKYNKLYPRIYYKSIVLKSNKFLDYNFLSSDYGRLIIGLKDIFSKVGFSEKTLESYMKNKLVQEELLFSLMDHWVVKNYHFFDDGYDYDDYAYYGYDYCYDYGYDYGFDYDFDYNKLNINNDNITMYFIPVDNYTEEVLDNIINRYGV